MIDQSIPPTVPERDISSILALVELLADPAATRARIDALLAQQKTLEEVTAALNEARASHEQARVNVLSGENASKARIAAAEAVHTEACAERERALKVRETAIARLEAQTKADREAASTLKATLERRLAAVHAAARDVAA